MRGGQANRPHEPIFQHETTDARALAGKADDHVQPVGIVGFGDVRFRRPCRAGGMRMVDADDLERRLQLPQRSTQVDVLAIVDPISCGAGGHVAHRHGGGHRARSADQQPATLERRVTPRVSRHCRAHVGRNDERGAVHCPRSDRWGARHRRRASADPVSARSTHVP